MHKTSKYISKPPDDKGYVNWDKVQQFIEILKQKTGGNYRLPTEAEWEYACRSGGQQEKYCGGDNPDSVAWLRQNSGRKTHPVGQKQANGLGLYDMSGNVWEWTEDCWHDSYKDAPSDGGAWISGGDCNLRVVRGGSWTDHPELNTSTYRLKDFHTFKGFAVIYGFRLAKSK